MDIVKEFKDQIPEAALGFLVGSKEVKEELLRTLSSVQNSESQREKNESSRESAEAARVDAESRREENESSRESAEAARRKLLDRFGGVATPSTNPGTPEVNTFYAASEEGTYTHFDGMSLGVGEVAFFVWDGSSWRKDGITTVNTPYEEDLTVNSDGELQFANRSSEDGMGYVILRKNKTFAEQVIYPNTIYEVRYDFDLGGENLTLPDNITLRYAGGVLKNGTVKCSSLNTVDMPAEQKALPIFAEGVNLNDNELIASHIGMVEGENGGSINDTILDQVIAKGKNLRLDGHYRFDKKHYLDGAISIRGGSLYSRSILFVMREGSSITLEDVAISPNSSYIIGCDGNLDYIVDSIIVNRCTFKGEVSLVRFYGADVPYETQPHGLRRFIVKDSYIECDMSFIVLTDLCVTEEFAFFGNTVRNMKYSLIHLGETNDYTNKADKVDYWADVRLEKNDIQGEVSTEGGYYLTPLVSDKQKRVFVRNNIVSNIIGTSGQVCYECYGSCDEYYCENNVFKNIVHLPSNGIAPATFPEIFKSKGSGSLRKAYANRWELDFAECRDLCRQAGVEWTDEAFANISFVSLFQFTDTLGVLDFCDNEIIVKNGLLRLRQSSFNFTEALLNRNNFDIAEVDSSFNYLIPVWGGGIEKITIRDNNFNVHNGYMFLTGGQAADSFRSVFVESNVTNFDRLIGFIRTGYDLNVKNNKLLRNEKSARSSMIILLSANKINGEDFYHLSATETSFHLGALSDVSWKCHIEHEPSASSLITLFDSDNTDNDDYDIIIEADGQKLGYKVRYSDSEMTAYDEWDNILVSSPRAITSNGDWITVYKSTSTRIIFQAQTNRGMSLRIYSLTEDARYRDIHIASPKYGIIQPIIANAYTKGAYRFDRTLGKPVWWDGTKWVDANGTSV